MSRYRKISTCIWNDEKTRGLSTTAKLVMVFLLTHPHMTSIGAIRANAPGLACDLGIGARRFKTALNELVDCGIARVADDCPLIFFPNFLSHNPPENPNVVKSWAAGYADLPESPLKLQALMQAQGVAVQKGRAFQAAFQAVFGQELDNCGNFVPRETGDAEGHMDHEAGIAGSMTVSGGASMLQGECCRPEAKRRGPDELVPCETLYSLQGSVLDGIDYEATARGNGAGGNLAGANDNGADGNCEAAAHVAGEVCEAGANEACGNLTESCAGKYGSKRMAACGARDMDGRERAGSMAKPVMATSGRREVEANAVLTQAAANTGRNEGMAKAGQTQGVAKAIGTEVAANAGQNEGVATAGKPEVAVNAGRNQGVANAGLTPGMEKAGQNAGVANAGGTEAAASGGKRMNAWRQWFKAMSEDNAKREAEARRAGENQERNEICSGGCCLDVDVAATNSREAMAGTGGADAGERERLEAIVARLNRDTSLEMERYKKEACRGGRQQADLAGNDGGNGCMRGQGADTGNYADDGGVPRETAKRCENNIRDRREFSGKGSLAPASGAGAGAAARKAGGKDGGRAAGRDAAGGRGMRLLASDGVYELSPGWVGNMAELYPELDVAAELRSIAAWLLSNPKRRPMAMEMTRFLNNCLNRERRNQGLAREGRRQRVPMANEIMSGHGSGSMEREYGQGEDTQETADFAHGV